jgi:Flp pilus assembly protein TadD
MEKVSRNLFYCCLFLFITATTQGQSLNSYEKMDALYVKRDFKGLEMACQNNLKTAPKDQDIYLETLYFLVAERVLKDDLPSAVPYLKMFRDAHTAREAALSKKNGAPFILIDSRFPGLYYELGKYYFEMQNWAEAIRWLRLAKTGGIQAEDPMLYFRLSNAYMNVRDYDNARKYLMKELELDPKEPSPYYNIACAYAIEKNKEKSLEWLKKAIAAHTEYGPQAAKDPDFAPLKNDPEFIKVTSTR